MRSSGSSWRAGSSAERSRRCSRDAFHHDGLISAPRRSRFCSTVRWQASRWPPPAVSVELRVVDQAAIELVRHRGCEVAAVGQVHERRRVAGDRGQALGPRPVESRDRPQKAPRVRVLRVVEDLFLGAVLDHPAGVHHDHAVGDLRHHPHVVGDQHHRGVELRLQAGDQRPGSAPGWSRPAPWSARRRSTGRGCTRVPSRSSLAAAYHPRTGGDSRRPAPRGSGCQPRAGARLCGRGRRSWRATRGPGAARRSATRPCTPDSARSSDPERSSPSRRRGCPACATPTPPSGRRPCT